MFKMITNGYLVECGSCGNEEIAKTVREAKSVFDFHECSDTPNKVSGYSFVTASNPVELVKPFASTAP